MCMMLHDAKQALDSTTLHLHTPCNSFVHRNNKAIRYMYLDNVSDKNCRYSILGYIIILIFMIFHISPEICQYSFKYEMSTFAGV